MPAGETSMSRFGAFAFFPWALVDAGNEMASAVTAQTNQGDRGEYTMKPRIGVPAAIATGKSRQVNWSISHSPLRSGKSRYASNVIESPGCVTNDPVNPEASAG